MSQENVEIVERFFAAVERAMESYWSDPRSIAAAMKEGDLTPEGEEAFSFLDPDIVWNAGDFGTFRGREGVAAGWDDFFEIADRYAVSVLELKEGQDDLVYAAVERAITAKASGIQTTIPDFSVIKIEAGSIVQIDAYADRAEALEAAGLSE
jgi:ketosteroid isomerase-like protein